MLVIEESNNKFSPFINVLDELAILQQKKKSSNIFFDLIKNISSSKLQKDENDYQLYENKLNKLFEDFTTFNKKVNEKEFASLSSLEDIFSMINKSLQENIEYNKNTSCNFNALKFFSIDETLHSKLLAKLLNPKAEHGQGNKFLVEFLKLLKIEEPHKGDWSITAETGRIDVLLKRSSPPSIIIIENKSNWATDQQNQLYRYWYQEIYSKTKETNVSFYTDNLTKYRIIYLPPNEFKQPEPHSYSRPNEENWKNSNLPEQMPLTLEIRTFKEFITIWLENCICSLPESNHRMREYLKQYNEICKTL